MFVALYAIIKFLLSGLRGLIDVFLTSLYPNLEWGPEPDIQGKRVLVTGSNVGIGKEVALSFAQRGAEVFLLCRDEEKARVAQKDIVTRTGNPKVFVELVDFSNLQSVDDLVARWNSRPTKASRNVDILINNPGLVMTTKVTTVDGFETCYQVNMLGPFALTMSFLHRGFFSPTARIVQVSSNALYLAPHAPDPQNLNFKHLNEGSGGFLAGTLLGLYSSSKAQQVIFTQQLQRRLSRLSKYQNIVVQSCHPGLVKSAIWDRSTILSNSKGLSWFIPILSQIVAIECHQAARTALFLAISEEAGMPEMKGGFWERSHQKWLPVWMSDNASCKELWKRWVADAKVNDPFHECES